SEVILIKDDNTAETTLFHSHTSSITFSSFSAEKIVCTLSYKYSVSDNFHCHLFSSVSLFFISSVFTLSVLTSDPAGSMLFFNFS
ncbi:hypothetical protein BDFG_04754, partial [Blastomyces dermatitidis ATCC 26199]